MTQSSSEASDDAETGTPGRFDRDGDDTAASPEWCGNIPQRWKRDLKCFVVSLLIDNFI